MVAMSFSWFVMAQMPDVSFDAALARSVLRHSPHKRVALAKQHDRQAGNVLENRRQGVVQNRKSYAVYPHEPSSQPLVFLDE